MNNNSAFMELVQLHERMWGMEQYPGRPSLADLLSRPIVVMWSGDDKPVTKTIPVDSPRRFTFSVHDDVDDLNEILLGMIIAGKVTPTPYRRLSKLYVKQKPVDIKGVRLLVADK
jgi:hypothetical protein